MNNFMANYDRFVFRMSDANDSCLRLKDRITAWEGLVSNSPAMPLKRSALQKR